MLLYTVINSAGYYAQVGDPAMVGTFSVLTVATLALLADHVGRPDRSTAARVGEVSVLKLVAPAILSTVVLVAMWDGRPDPLVEKGVLGVLINVGVVVFLLQ